MSDTFGQRWKKVSLPNKLNVACTAVIAIATVCYVIAAFRQLDKMADTLREMKLTRDGGTDQANQVIGNMNWLARTMQESLRENQAATVATDKRSREALNASIDIARSGQRAWISATPSITGSPATGEAWKIKITMGNHGATPAIRVLPKAFVRGYAPTKETIDGNPDEPPVATDIGPRQEGSKSFDTQLSPPNIAAIIMGQIKLYAFGTIHYNDVFGVPRITEFCAVYNPRTKEMELCQSFNRME